MFFVGTGYAMADLKELAAKLGLQKKIKFMGVITSRDDIREYYAAADLFLFPSIYDNAPLVIREAGAMETPSLLVSGSTSSENITDNFNGFLIENSVDSMATRLRELIQNPQTILPVGQNASRTIARSWENVAEEVLDRYTHLIERKWKI